VEVVLDGHTGPPLRVCTYERAGYFGEMSLFDGAPRSASAIALCACRIVELPHCALESKMSNDLLRKLLVETAGRVRRTDVTVREYADKIYRSANANAQAAVSVELDSIKTLYQRTEQLAEHALERAEQLSQETLARTEQRAAAVLERADGTRADVEQQITRALSLLKKRVAPLLAVLGLLAGWVARRSRR
jgi:CRP-like cAMP-binding protein